MYQTHKTRFWWEIAELPPEKEKITNQTHEKPHKVSAEKKKIPTFGFSRAKSSCHCKKTPSSTWGRKIILPKEAALPQAVLPCPLFLTWVRQKLELW